MDVHSQFKQIIQSHGLVRLKVPVSPRDFCQRYYDSNKNIIVRYDPFDDTNPVQKETDQSIINSVIRKYFYMLR